MPLSTAPPPSTSAMPPLPPYSRTTLNAAALWKAKSDLGTYGIVAHNLSPADHHNVWIDAITRLVAGKAARRRLLVIAPPGHAKSTWVSLIFPAWHLGRHPDQTILFF